MIKFFKCLFGLNAASVIRGSRLGLRELWESSHRSFCTVHPMQDRKQLAQQETLAAIPEVPLDKIIGEAKIEIRITTQKREDGMLPDCEALALLSILKLKNPGEVLEIGTFMGHTTRRMAENLTDSIIHTIDLPPDFSAAREAPGLPPKDDFHLINRRIVGLEFKGLDCEKRIRQHLGDTAKFDFQKIGRPTFFFIDGSHTYEYCKLDSEKCLALCPEHGTFLWHDCDELHPGVARFILEWRKSGRNVVRIKDTCLAYWSAADASP